MKYPEEDYINCEFYGTENERNYKAKVVKIRFDRKCRNCGNNQARGSQMLHESCIFDDEGFKRSYTCLQCIDKWLDYIKGKAD